MEMKISGITLRRIVTLRLTNALTHLLTYITKFYSNLSLPVYCFVFAAATIGFA